MAGEPFDLDGNIADENGDTVPIGLLEAVINGSVAASTTTTEDSTYAFFFPEIDGGEIISFRYEGSNAANETYTTEGRRSWIMDLYIPLPPASITNLTNITYASDYITWTFNRPSNADFNHTEIYINDIFAANVSDEYYNATGLGAGTKYNISTRTVDINGNVNTTWVNHSATTASTPTPPAYGVNLTNLSALTGTTTEGVNATHILTLENNGSAEDSYALSIDNPDGASIAALNITTPLLISAGLTMTFSLNVTNTSAGTFRVNVTARSNNDSTKFGYVNTTTNVTAPAPTPTPTPTAAPSSGGGSSGGGGGGGGGGAPASTEKYENLGPQENREEYVPRGAMAFKFNKQDLVSEVGFTAKTNEGLVTAKVELLKGKPTLAKSDAPGTVQMYLNILVGTSGYSTKIEDTYVVFNVPDTWLKENGFETVKLMKLKGDVWIDLKTENLGSGKYKAWTNGFSSFAIVGAAKPAEAVTAVATAAPEATPAAVETPVVAETPTTSPPPEGMSTLTSILVLGALLAGVVAIRLAALVKKRHGVVSTPQLKH